MMKTFAMMEFASQGTRQPPTGWFDLRVIYPSEQERVQRYAMGGGLDARLSAGCIFLTCATLSRYLDQLSEIWSVCAFAGIPGVTDGDLCWSLAAAVA